MVESPTRYAHELQPPDCPHCEIRMRWYWSMKVADSPIKIDHFFDCPKCKEATRLATTEALSGSDQTLDGALALPFAFCAA